MKNSASQLTFCGCVMFVYHGWEVIFSYLYTLVYLTFFIDHILQTLSPARRPQRT